jgi:mycofactocin precursor
MEPTVVQAGVVEAAETSDPAPESPDVRVPEREQSLVEVELLVEDLSIDGMCGVY